MGNIMAGHPKNGQTAKDKVKPKMVTELAKIGCTLKEMSAILGIAQSTILLNFPDELEAGRADLHVSIRRAQLDLALNGKDRGMLIHLGKVILKQNEQITVVHEHTELDNASDEELFDIVKKDSDKNSPITH